MAGWLAGWLAVWMDGWMDGWVVHPSVTRFFKRLFENHRGSPTFTLLHALGLLGVLYLQKMLVLNVLNMPNCPWTHGRSARLW